MSWKEILKAIMTTREFLQELQKTYGGEITNKSSRRSRYGRVMDKIDMTLTHDKGYVKVNQRGTGEFHVNVNGEFYQDYNLRKILPKILE